MTATRQSRLQRYLSSMSWISYEDVARELLHRFREDFGLSSVEGKQQIGGEATN